MRVTLGYGWDGHAPDDTIEVPDSVGRRLLREGKARRADDEVAAEREAADAVPEAPAQPAEPHFLKMTLSELRAFAEQHEIDIPTDVRKRPAIAELVRAAWTRESAPAPDAGTETEEAPDGR